MNLEERLHLPDWPQRAFACKHNAGGKCSLCAVRAPWPYLGLVAHHNTYARMPHELPTDLVSLCHPCHCHHEWRKRYGDLLHVRLAELRGLIERTRPRLEEVHAFYLRDVREMDLTMQEMLEKIGFLLAATAAGRAGEEWRRDVA